MKKFGTMVLLGLFWVTFFQFSCKKAKSPQDQAWYRYISAYTSGDISRKAQVRVLFVGNVGTEGQDAAELEDYLEFSPALSGKTEWKSPRELVFTPDRELVPGILHRAVLNIRKFMSLPREYARFEFTFSVIRESLAINLEGLAPLDEISPNRFLLRGMLTSRDSQEGVAVKKILSARHAGKALAIEWAHENEGRSHSFVIRAIQRLEQPSQVEVKWDGSPVGAEQKGSRQVDVPSLGQFDLLDAEAVLEPAASVLLRFSDPLKKNQNLRGLITIPGHEPTFEIDNNVVRVYSSKGFDTAVDVSINPGVRNFNDRRLEKRLTRTLAFQRLSPQVRFVGKGVILPEKEKLTIPFEAVSLRSIQVTAFQIFQNNMAQFFQQNNLEGKENLSMVGRFLWRKTVPLTDQAGDTGNWRRYSLDVTQLLSENPGSIFRIIISFNRGNSAYPCTNNDAPVLEPSLQNQDDVSYRDYSNWDYSYEYYYEEGRNGWADRSDPCKDAYYNPRFNNGAVQARNFLASNLGLVAKRGDGFDLHVVTTDIRTAEPLAGVLVRAFNFQNQLLGEGSSDGSGFLTLGLPGQPFFIEATQGKDRGYLRLSKQGALATSHFDVGGEKVQKGIKGAIYGERGVWRPGDDLYLTFVLFDREHKLPAEHPVLLELYNPKGQLIQTRKPARSLDAFHSFRLRTAEAAPTGNWKARVRVGGLSFEQNVKIETVVPNRLKIDFQPGAEKLVKEKPTEAALRSQWLHGAVAANLKFDARVRLAPRPTSFPRWPDYIFDDPARVITASEQQVADGRLDANGVANFPIKLEMEEAAPGMMDAQFTVRVFEESGDFSSDAVTLPFYPYKSFVGIRVPKGDEMRGMLLTDQEHLLQIITVDPEGKPVSRDKLEVSLYKVEWKWWWDRSGDSLAQYIANTSHVPLLKGEVETRDGSGQWKFQIKYPQWGRYLVRVVDPQSGHAAGKAIYIDWPGWAGRAREEKGSGATRLNFSADKERYQVGEKATIFLPDAPQGRALVSLENNSRILKQMWVSTKAGENRFEIELDESMSPNIYVHVTLLQPHSGKKSDTPIRLYGVIPVMVENPRTRLEPLLKVVGELKPLQEFKVGVEEKSGRAMTYTLAVVDEGLLGLTRYTAPDLRRKFYNREALGVLTWDLFDDIAEAYGADLSRLLALGGDEEGAAAGSEKKQRRFPPVVLFAGPFSLEAGKTAEHKFTMPQYVGAVRVMAVAGRDGAFGVAEKSIPVRQDLMILPTLPRVVRPGETFDLPVSVFVSHAGIRKVQVQIDAGDRFLVDGPKIKVIEFKKPGDEIVFFPVTVSTGVGQGSVYIKATAGSRKAESRTAIPILAANPRIMETLHAEVPPGESRQIAIKAFGLKGTNDVTLEYSMLPPFNLQKRLQFLIRYPHGCLEQTLSTAFPQLYLKYLIKLDAGQQKKIETYIATAIEKMRSFQAPSGGFSYWPGEYEVHHWTSAYAGYFLLEASRLGYRVPVTMLDPWKKHQKTLANSWTAGPEQGRLVQAFRLYTLALAGAADLGAMNRLRENTGLESAAAVLLAGAFQASGQGEAAEDLLRKCTWQIAKYRDDSRTFGSDFRDKAVMVRTLVHMGQPGRARKFLDEIVGVMASDTWYSTQETAYALMAIAAYYGGSPAKPFRFRAGWQGEAPREVEAVVPFFQQEYSPFTARERTLTVANPGEGRLYVTATIAGIPPAGGEQAHENNLRLQVSYQDMNGAALDTVRLTQGNDFQVKVDITNLSKQSLHNLALTHIVPAGCQIANPRLFTDEPAGGYYDYQDVRDDRILTYFRLGAGAKKTFTAVLNASYGGRFYQPGISVESMYDRSFHANSTGKWVEITR
ncbi:MAG TPA: MG2 domain-containing protein [Patescibacteria group bacterium]|nr:MG2 domain-containing protein [Patescibacteria group bacterium]